MGTGPRRHEGIWAGGNWRGQGRERRGGKNADREGVLGRENPKTPEAANSAACLARQLVHNPSRKGSMHEPRKVRQKQITGGQPRQTKEFRFEPISRRESPKVVQL